jgi:osmotically inducible protein OsmC
MKKRNARALWQGDLKDGEGTLKLGSGIFEGEYSFSSRFEEGEGTNPEELIGAAHAGCFSMALSNLLAEKGYDPKEISTKAEVALEEVGGDFEITEIKLDTVTSVPEIELAEFKELARTAKESCPVSKALAGTDIVLEACLSNE